MQEITKEIEVRVAEVDEIVKAYEGYKIATPQDYSYAGKDFKKVKDKIKELTELRMEMTRPLDESKNRIISFFKKPIEALTQIQNNIASCMRNFQLEQERKAREQQEMLRKEQERKARELLRRAENVKSEAKKEELKEQAENLQNITPIIKPEIPEVEKITTRTNWKFEVIDEKLVPREYLKVDEVKLGQVVRATKGTLQIPGIRIYSEENITGSR